MPYRILVQDTASAPWREVKQLEDDDTGVADVDRLAATGRYHAVALRRQDADEVTLYARPQVEVAQAA